MGQKKRIEALQTCSSDVPQTEKEAVENFPIGKGVVLGSGTAQDSGFLGKLLSIGVPFAIDMIGHLFGKGLHVGLPPPPKGAKGMHINPPPFFSSWGVG